MKRNLTILALTLAITAFLNQDTLGEITTGSVEISQKSNSTVDQFDSSNQTLIFERTISNEQANSIIEIKIKNEVTKDGITITHTEEDILNNLIIENGETYLLDNGVLKYALLGAYKSDGTRLNNNFYYLVSNPHLLSTSINDINIKVKTFLKDDVAHKYRGVKIETTISAIALQNTQEPVKEIFLDDESENYFNLISPVNGTIDEFSQTSEDENISNKSLVDGFLSNLRS